MTNNDNAPVLDDVVKRGDEDLIKAARLEREILDELNRMAPREKSASPARTSSTISPSQDGTLEQAIDRIVQHHSDAMRQDIQKLLKERLD